MSERFLSLERVNELALEVSSGEMFVRDALVHALADGAEQRERWLMEKVCSGCGGDGPLWLEDGNPKHACVYRGAKLETRAEYLSKHAV